MKNDDIDDFIALIYQTDNIEWEPTPKTKECVAWLADLFDLLFPNNDANNLSVYSAQFKKNRIDLINILLSYIDPKDIEIETTVKSFYDSLKEIYLALRHDATMIYEKDPAAVSVREVIVAYPGFYAIAVYRIAHRLSQLATPILPRILSEYAHGKTGVDIHPKATINVPFCIDHGTGIVIGATSIIGKNVTIFQGVTIGASQVSKQLSETKRHPTIEDNVTIYAQSIILGGQTVIGHDSVIGGSVFLTKSVQPYSHVFNTRQLRIEVKE